MFDQWLASTYLSEPRVYSAIRSEAIRKQRSAKGATHSLRDSRFKEVQLCQQRQGYKWPSATKPFQISRSLDAAEWGSAPQSSWDVQ